MPQSRALVPTAQVSRLRPNRRFDSTACAIEDQQPFKAAVRIHAAGRHAVTSCGAIQSAPIDVLEKRVYAHFFPHFVGEKWILVCKPSGFI